MSTRRATPQIATGGLFAVAALSLLVAVVADGGFTASVAGLELRFTGSSAAVLFAIGGLGFVVVAFSSRYCIDDPARGRLLWLMLSAAASAGVVAVAGNLLTLLAAWIATTVILAALLFHRRDHAVVRAGRGRAWRTLATGDALLLVAAAIVLTAAGNAGLGDLDRASARLADTSVLGIDAGALVAILIVGAAAARCAQVPFGAWLPATLAAPTPVSALLHAGVVNGGALLLIGLAPIVFSQPAAVWMLFALASATMLWGTGQMIGRPDVKGGLMLSTRGQMGFMLLQCAIGAFASAIFHLIAHGMYKAYLFLGSGNAIAEQRMLASSPRTPVPPATGRRALRQAAVALIAPAVAIAAAVALIAPSLTGTSSGLVLLLFAFATGAQATWWWQRFREPHGASAGIGAIALLAGAGAYVALLEQAKDLFSIDPLSSPVPAAALLPVLLLAASATALRWLAAAGLSPGPTDAWARSLQRRAYATALSIGSWTPPRSRPAGSLVELPPIEPDTAPLEAR